MTAAPSWVDQPHVLCHAAEHPVPAEEGRPFTPLPEGSHCDGTPVVGAIAACDRCAWLRRLGHDLMEIRRQLSDLAAECLEFRDPDRALDLLDWRAKMPPLL